ncbi:hypothetical protein [Rhodohalobacter sulfatireducens]|uniref:SMODS and SLOG-associating 2TM effector domain-containing protein n=1 Tax=Rhodohalobacter sulfatireducens TaxID=2911366 RepID=A0ABS9KAA9_9BACT|nr:hypothetical protein [Rhodohalobacter sulfatireducens]MCG2587789.1 hypothetical protein [Rhodohalobacter sulfatireducens]
MNFILRYKFSLLLIIGVTGAFFLIGTNGVSDKYFFSIIGTLITLYIGLTQYQLNNDKIFKELFNNFNQRYDEEFNDLINELSSNGDKRVLNRKEKTLIIDYLNLCAEEYLWYKKSRIPKDVWTAWKNGIESNLEIEEVREVVSHELIKFKDSYYGLFDEINFKSDR